jgi:ABC-type nitrate/sulfonate/bicarbonate transport system substrate-binding protein
MNGPSPARARRRLLAAFIAPILFALVLSPACNPAGREDGAKVVRLAVVPSAFHLPLMVAHDRQLFAKHGLTSEVLVFNNTNDMMNALLHGDADVSGLGSGGVFPLEATSPGRVRFVYGQNNKSYSLLVAPGSRIESLEDLRGKRIGTWMSPTPRALLHLILDPRVGRDGFEIVPVEFRFLNMALHRGDVDALFSTDTLIQEAVGAGQAKYLSPLPLDEFVLKPFFGGGGLVQRDLESRRPEVYRAALAAVREAVEFIRQHEAEARRSLVTHARVSEDVAARAPVDEYLLPEEVDLANAQRVAELLFEQKVLERKIDVAPMFR